MAHYYKASGRFSPLAFVTFIILALTAFPLLGLIYAYAIWYIPFIYVNFLIAAGFGFVVGLLIQKFVIRLGKVRNALLGLLFGIIGGTVALYFHWAVWVDLVLNISDTVGGDGFGMAVSNIKILEVFTLAFNPGALFSLISEINELGTWGLAGDSSVSGTFLLIIWIIEFGIVVVLSLITPAAGAKEPFSEVQGKWYEQDLLPPFDFISDPSLLLQAIEYDSTEIDKVLNRPFSHNESHSIFTLYTCAEDAHLLSINNKIAKTNKKGEIEFSDQEILEPITISDSMKSLLLSFPAERVETAEARDAFDKL